MQTKISKHFSKWAAGRQQSHLVSGKVTRTGQHGFWTPASDASGFPNAAARQPRAAGSSAAATISRMLWQRSQQQSLPAFPCSRQLQRCPGSRASRDGWRERRRLRISRFTMILLITLLRSVERSLVSKNGFRGNASLSRWSQDQTR